MSMHREYKGFEIAAYGQAARPSGYLPHKFAISDTGMEWHVTC